MGDYDDNHPEPKVIVFGYTGMLGTKVVAELTRRHIQAVTPYRKAVPLDDASSLHYFIRMVAADGRGVRAIINCAGVTNKAADPKLMVAANGLGPIMVADIAGAFNIPVIHVSTDCVFSGRAEVGRQNTVEDVPDPIDVYGVTKRMGEIGGNVGGVVTNVRTSFIGFTPANKMTKEGLLEWVIQLDKGAEVNGYMNAWWSGSTASAVAKHLVDMACHSLPLPPTIHLATLNPISKYFLLKLLVENLELPIIVHPVTSPHINRSLQPTPGWVLDPIQEVLGDLVDEYTGLRR